MHAFLLDLHLSETIP